MQESDLFTSEVLERLRRRASRLEVGAAMLRAEIESLARRFAMPDMAVGRRLDLGLDKIFRPGTLDPGKPVEAYQRLLDAFCLAFDTRELAPEIFVWQSNGVAGGTPDEGRRAVLNVDIRDKRATSWILMEIDVGWETITAHPQFDLCLQARATSKCDLGANLYYIDRNEGAKQTTYQSFVLHEELQVETIGFQVPDSVIENADTTQPPKIFLHLSNVDQSRIEIHALEALEQSPEYA